VNEVPFPDVQQPRTRSATACNSASASPDTLSWSADKSTERSRFVTTFLVATSQNQLNPSSTARLWSRHQRMQRPRLLLVPFRTCRAEARSNIRAVRSTLGLWNQTDPESEMRSFNPWPHIPFEACYRCVIVALSSRYRHVIAVRLPSPGLSSGSKIRNTYLLDSRRALISGFLRSSANSSLVGAGATVLGARLALYAEYIL